MSSPLSSPSPLRHLALLQTGGNGPVHPEKERERQVLWFAAHTFFVSQSMGRGLLCFQGDSAFKLRGQVVKGIKLYVLLDFPILYSSLDC